MLTWAIVAMVAMLVTVMAILKKIAEEPMHDYSRSTTWHKSDTPLAFSVAEEVNHDWPEARGQLQKAINWWNHALGFRIYNDLGTVDWKGSRVKVVGYSSGAANGDGDVAYTRNIAEGGQILNSCIYIDLDKMPDTSNSVLFRQLVHELGHVLGLLHDPIPHSVMYRDPTDLPKLWLANDDFDFLRAVYSR